MAERKATSGRRPKQGKAAAKKATPAKKTRTTRRKRAAPKKATATADKVAEHAKAAGAVSRGGKGLTIVQRRLRDSAVAARSAAGFKQAEIAEEFELTKRQVQRILQVHEAMPSGLDDRPMALLEELLRGFRADIADAEAMAVDFAERHPSAAIGAKRLARDARVGYAELLMVLGKLPTNLELYRSEAQMIHIAEEMVGKLESLARGEVEADEVLGFFRGLLPERDSVPALTA